MKYFEVKFNIIFIIVFLLFIIFPSNINAIGVQPLVYDLHMERGESSNFDLNFIPTNFQETVNLNFYYPKQLETGDVEFIKGDKDKHEVINWISIPKRVIIPPNEIKTIVGEINVPYEYTGSHSAIIMVEPERKKVENGVTFKVRYAIRININIDAPGLKERAQLLGVSIKENQYGKPKIISKIENNSSLLYKASGEVTIRDESRRLVQRIKIRSEHAKQAGRDETTIYPGSEVIFSGEVTEPLTSGKYDLQAFIQYADGKQIIERKTVEIGDEFVNSANMDYLEITPANINDELRKGGVHTGAIDIRNRTGNPINVKVEPKEIESKYEYSVFKDFDLELRGDQQFTLEGRRSKRPVLIARSSREIKDGGYYGQIKVTAFDPETDEELQSKNIDMAFIVGEEYKCDGKVLNLTNKRVDNEVLLSATVSNEGDVHFKPRAKIYLSQDNEIKYTKYLEIPEEDSRILPEKVGLLRNYFNDIKAGKYKAEVTLIYQEEEISKAEFDLEIKETENGEE